MNRPSFLHTTVFFFICIFFMFVALNWEVRQRFRFRRAVRFRQLVDDELISTIDDYIALKSCRDPFVENFQSRHSQFKQLNRLWIINSADYWIGKYTRELKRRKLDYNLSVISQEEQVRAVKAEIRSRIKSNGLLYEINSLLGGFFGVFLEVRSLEFFLAWGQATRKPIIGGALKRVFVWFSSYFTGIVVPCAGAVDEQRPVIMPYDHILQMVKRAKVARLQPCSCKAYFLPGEDVPRDSCMGFEYIEDLDELSLNGYHEDFQVREQVLDKLRECEEKGLVHQFMTVSRPTGKKGYVLCNCGESCIPVFLFLQYGIPMVRGSGLTVIVEQPEKCSGCGQCRERCVFRAAELVGDRPVMHAQKCLGCGLCVGTCAAKIRRLKY